MTPSADLVSNVRQRLASLLPLKKMLHTGRAFCEVFFGNTSVLAI